MAHHKLVQSLLAWFAINARDLPWRRTRDSYAIWVSEIMLQQTQVKTVLPYWERWMSALPTVQALANASSDLLHKLWEGLGYYTRVRNLQKASQRIVQRHGGSFPSSYEDILELPGIGRYTAGAICSIAFNQPEPVLDGNIIRVLTRIFGIDGAPRGKSVNGLLWSLAEQLVRTAQKLTATAKPPGSPALPSIAGCCSQLNQALMELGALVCTPRQPRCDACPVRSLCVACREDRVLELPNLAPRVRTTPRRFVAFVVKNGDRILARQRPAEVVNAHLWEVPNVEVLAGNGELNHCAQIALGFRPTKLESLGSIQHTITRYRITVDVFEATLAVGHHRKRARGQWLRREQLELAAFTSAHRKILRRFCAK